MLVLTFRVKQAPYAVPVARVIEVVPRVALRAVPHAPGCLLGLLHYRGTALPVIDLGLLLGGSACADRLDTRILLVRGSLDGRSDGRIGLMAEEVNDLVEVDPSRLAMEPPPIAGAPYLGQVFETESGLIQLIDPARISLGGSVELARMVEP